MTVIEKVDSSWVARTRWIWAPNYSEDVDSSVTVAKVVLFRRTFQLDKLPSAETVLAHISADTRYTLFVNGHKVCYGPCRSYLGKWNYESVNIREHLKLGTNVVSVQVLRYSIHESGPANMMKAHIPGFIFHSTVSDDLVLSSDESWKCHIDESISVKSTETFSPGGPFLPIYQNVDASKSQHNWKSGDFDDTKWENAAFVKILFPKPAPWTLTPRSIPFLTHIQKRFTGVSKIERTSNDLTSSGLADFVINEADLEIPPDSEVVFDIDAGELTTGFPLLKLSNGRNTKIEILYAECYETKPSSSKSFGQSRIKGDRTDTDGVLIGGIDSYIVAGNEVEEYEPLWMRTFRFVQLKITTATEPLTLKSFTYFSTHYPLEDQTSLQLSNPELAKYWDISRRTLKNCMHETYEDCPYYEQSQFVMDARAQMLFTYQLSRDDRLARKTIQEFFASIRGDGFVETFFPASFSLKNIPAFSLYWVLMLYDHMLYFGDRALLKTYFGALDTVLSSFEGKINQFDMVGRFEASSWAYVDWVKEWSKFPIIAFPPVYMKNGTIAYVSLLYSYALQKSAEIAAFLGRTDTATEYLSRSDEVIKAVNKHCFDGEFYTDGPETADRCQHTQVFAVLAGAIQGQRAKTLLHKTFAPGNGLPECSYAMSFYVFRAFEAAGIYGQNFTKTLLKPYENMAKLNLTTWAEDDVNQRSDCHAWGASPLYETVACVFGLKPAPPSSESDLVFSPLTDDYCSGTAKIVTKFGIIEIEINHSPEGETSYKLKTERDISVEVNLNDEPKILQLKKGIEETISAKAISLANLEI